MFIHRTKLLKRLITYVAWSYASNCYFIMKLRITINRNGRNKEEKTKLRYGWVNDWCTVDELIKAVSNGWAWCATWFQAKKRLAENCMGSNVIVFDFDGELSLEKFWACPTARAWCAFTYTSASHTEAVNRFRAVFPIEGIPLTDAWEHKCFYEFIELKLLSETGVEFDDRCGQKPERLWFGNSNAHFVVNDGAFMPANTRATVPVPDPPARIYGTTDGITDLDIRRVEFVLDNLLDPSEDGEYNSIYVPVTAACAAIGTVIEECWVRWVQRGHHGEKSSNCDTSLKWNGLGTHSGPGAIFALVKKQDPSWARKLPFELSFNPGSGTGLDIDAILMQQCAAPKAMFTSRT
jgi:hypothetical protein